jgi:hypothetical protein
MSSFSPTEFKHPVDSMFVRCDTCLWVERNYFQHLLYTSKISKSLILTAVHWTELKHLDLDLRQIGVAAGHGQSYGSDKVMITYNACERGRGCHLKTVYTSVEYYPFVHLFKTVVHEAVNFIFYWYLNFWIRFYHILLCYSLIMLCVRNSRELVVL